MNGYAFTDEVRRALMRARESAVDLGHEYVGAEHILLGILAVKDATANAVLEMLGVDRQRLAEGVIKMVRGGAPQKKPTGPDLPYTSRAKKTIELAMSEAVRLADD